MSESPRLPFSATQANWELLLERGFIPVNPGCGLMACGDSGEGRLAPLLDIYLESLRALAEQDMNGQTLLITIGPTREFWDENFAQDLDTYYQGSGIAPTRQVPMSKKIFNVVKFVVPAVAIALLVK